MQALSQALYTVEATLAVRGGDPIRQAEIASIRDFVYRHRPYLKGRVLDFGAGKPGTCREPQPYRFLVDPNAEYVPYDVGDPIPEGHFDVILCTQVLQYVENPARTVEDFAILLNRGGLLLLTAPTSWDEVESNDLWRFTQAGLERMLTKAGLTVMVSERRAEVKLGAFRFALGYGLVGVKA